VTKLRQSVPPVTISQFVEEVEDENRSRLISDISIGSAQGLAAIKCLDEGVDIPDLKQAFILASSRNYRQSVQRRGRLLRRAEGKTKALLFDFVVVHPSFHDQGHTSLLDWEKSLLTSELKRCVEFADLAINRESLLSSIAELKNKYQIKDEQ
jgi:superfamily II DNA or RNA helicase